VAHTFVGYFKIGNGALAAEPEKCLSGAHRFPVRPVELAWRGKPESYGLLTEF
jgi:hypothetical protein